MRKVIVVSAVNIRKGGTLTILRQCLSSLSRLAVNDSGIRAIAIVHSKHLASFPGIEYYERPDAIKSWFRRLWYEYVGFRRLSKNFGPVDLWLSLHDSTPDVEAHRQAVYCQTSFPFLGLRAVDFKYNYKTVMFTLFTRFVYKYNVHRNDYVIVQTEWLRKKFSTLLPFPRERIIVAPPERAAVSEAAGDISSCLPLQPYTFFYPATPDSHKNYECLCKAATMLERMPGAKPFQVILTMSGNECSYASYIYRKYKDVGSIRFVGYLGKDDMTAWYSRAQCMVFPSRIETWGLPISEFGAYGKPMLLSDSCYARETASGLSKVAFFNNDSAKELMMMMRRLMEGDESFLASVEKINIGEPLCSDWDALFGKLMS